MKRRWLIGAASLLVVVLIVGILYWQKTDTTKNGGNPVPSDQIKEYSVVFVSSSGAILKEETVPAGQSAIPPEDLKLSFGERFVGWDKPFTNVTEDLVITAITRSVEQENNAFILESACVQRKGTVTVPLLLSGSVCLSAFDLTISYDNEQLTFDSFAYEDGALIYNCINDEGIIRMNFVSTDNVYSDIDLCGIVFRSIGEAEETEVSLQVNTIVAFDDDEQPYAPEYTIYNAKLTIID